MAKATDHRPQGIVKSQSAGSRYTSLFRLRKVRKSEQDTIPQKQTPDDTLSDSNRKPRASDVTSASSEARSRVRRDIQSHIPDWIDDVVHAQLVEIAERLAEEARRNQTPPVSRPVTPSFQPERPGSAPSTIHAEERYGGILSRSSSVSRPSFAFPSTSMDVRRPASREYRAVCALGYAPHTTHSRNLSTDSSSTIRSGDTATSIYSSSDTSAGVHRKDHATFELLSKRMTWNDIAKHRLPAVDFAALRPGSNIFNTHTKNASVAYTIMDPSKAGVFDDMPPDLPSPALSCFVLSPTQAGVFDDAADVNKPLPPDPQLSREDRRKTFFVVSEVLPSPRVPESASPNSLQPEDAISVEESARLSGPFVDPFMFDPVVADLLPSIGEDTAADGDEELDGAIAELEAPAGSEVSISPNRNEKAAGDGTERQVETSRPMFQEHAALDPNNDAQTVSLEQAADDLMKLCLDLEVRRPMSLSWLGGGNDVRPGSVITLDMPAAVPSC